MNKTWLHFIGGYYKSSEKFLSEAKHFGITRRIPAQIAMGMSFGDKIILLRWKNKLAYAFAEMTISNIVLESQVSEKVCQKLAETGKAKPSGKSENVVINRECGSYVSIEPWDTDAEISEIIEMALKEVSGDQKLFVMIGGILTKVYDNPIEMVGVKFTRSVIHLSSWHKEQLDLYQSDLSCQQDVNYITPILDYRKHERLH